MPDEFDFDFPIVVLEADSPQAIGKLGLFDFLMPVGSTGVTFVAALPGILRVWGPEFTPAVQQSAFLRAASTLAQWGMVSGDTFGFLAQGAGLSDSDLATKYGVPLGTVQAWIADQVPVPPEIYRDLAFFVGTLDKRWVSDFALPTASFQPRHVRVFPNPPPVAAGQSPTPCEPCPPPPPSSRPPGC